MRSMRVRFRGISVLLLLLVSSIAIDALAQDVESDRLHDGKLLAQQAAMSSLKGDDSFILRESWWNGTIVPGAAKLIQQQLFKRNEYQFWFAVPGREAVASISIYNSAGELVESEEVSFEESNVASTVVRPDSTGIYYLRIALTRKTEADEDWAVIYGWR